MSRIDHDVIPRSIIDYISIIWMIYLLYYFFFVILIFHVVLVSYENLKNLKGIILFFSFTPRNKYSGIT